ncbi:diguanylate cyclase (GGDEF)-like protein [Lachnospiraceae bacterium PF1-21]|uniref:GGDEF domain-containing protein n=1 Tax=Ohessyouella blattaphilus TaxID=2949333 RepID=UPI003E2A8BCE
MGSRQTIIKRIKRRLKRDFFGEEYPLKYHIFSIFFFESLLLSVVSATTNTLLGKGILGIIFQWSFVAFCLVLLFSTPTRRMAASKTLILITGFVYIPFMYFQTAGYDGTALLFTLLFAFIASYSFSGKARVAIIVLNIVENLGCVLLQYNFPQLAVAHGSLSAKIIDTAVALVLTFGGLAIMTIWVNNAYEGERKRSLQLIEEIRSTNEQLEYLTNRDALTGVYNRRYIDQYLEQEVGHCIEHDLGLVLLLFDLDFFKKINDNYGHSFGDVALKRVAQTVDDSLRDSDMFARFGGEEFLAVIHEDSPEKALEVAERLRIAVSEITMRDGVKITVSIGMAFLQKDDTVQSLFDRVDQKLYDAKEKGRNRVCY